MKSLLALTLVLAFAVTAFAQADPDPDGIGIYFDMGGAEVCTATAAPFESVSAYLLITNPSALLGVSGWEAYVTVAGNAVAPSWTLAGGLDVDPSDEGFQVGIGTGGLALPYAPTIVLATWTGFIQSPADVVTFYVEGVPGSTSFANSPGYAGGGDAGDLRPLQVSSGTGAGAPVAMINGCDVVANEDMTFSNVKALFR